MTTTTREDRCLASASNYDRVYSTDIGAWCTELRQDEEGRYYLRTTRPFVGWGNRQYLSLADAIDWIATRARDVRNGCGYTVEQAVLIAEGKDDEAGRGRRED